MIVNVCQRGWSFKGAGQYYLHDKREEGEQTRSTSDRVGFVYTHNLPYDGRELSTIEGEKSLNLMAYTAKNAEHLKAQAGVSTRGRKAELGSVYSYSLSWNHGQSPNDEEMKAAALASLEFLKLDKNYQSVITEHTDTEHSHVHIITNLISPIDGKVANVGNDHTKFSEWAENYELEHGGIIIEQRVKNNEKRRELAKEKERRKAEREAHQKGDHANKPETGIVKHREQKIDKGEIENLYLSSKTAQEFQAGLENAGYSLARGDKRGVVLVNIETGKTHSLSRQISGLWKRDTIDQTWKGGLQNRFADFDQQTLLNVKQTRERNQAALESQLSRDDYETDRQIKLEEIAHKEGKNKAIKEALEAKEKRPEVSPSPPESEKATPTPSLTPDKEPPVIAPFYEQYDRIKEESDRAQRERSALEASMKDAYKLDEKQKALESLEAQREKLKLYQKLLGKDKDLTADINAHKRSIADALKRMEEARGALDKKLTRDVKREDVTSNDNEPTPSPVVDFEKAKQSKAHAKAQEAAEKQRRKEQFKAEERLRRQQERAQRERDLDKGFDMD